MSGDGIVSNELASIAGDAVDGTLKTFAPDPRKNPNAKELVEKFRAAGFEPEAYTLYSYAALQIVAAAAAKVGAVERPAEGCRRDQGEGPFKTAIGDIGYDAKGDITPPRATSCTMEEGCRRQDTPAPEAMSRQTSEIENARRLAPGIFLVAPNLAQKA